MTPNTDDQAAQLKAGAVAARRAARPAWRNAHVDRIIREREARETSREYRRAQLAAGTKQCSSCAQALPFDCFSPAFRDRPTARCKRCVAAATRARYNSDLDRARSRTRNRPARTERPRQTSEQRQRRAAERQRISEERQHKDAQRQRKASERVALLSALLLGTIPGETISSEESWNAATSELRSLWLLSGDKHCTACKSVVPPTAMQPPGPANFYPGKCRSCARAENLENHWRVFGRAPEGPKPILLKDGTAITIGEFARRHREREASRTGKQFNDQTLAWRSADHHSERVDEMSGFHIL